MPAIVRHLFVTSAAVAFLTGCAQQDTRPPEAAAEKRAKNIILFIGDGMGVSTVTAARIFDGQSQGKAGEEHVLPFETFDHVALVKTYNSNQQVPDSAGTATAMVTGVKTRAGVINIGPESQRRSCRGAIEHRLTPIADHARAHGKSLGFATTTRVTHATPAVMYAYGPEREWESDRFLPTEDWALGCRDVAWQLLNAGPEGGLDVALGGGRKAFYGSDREGERRSADADLVTPWLAADSRRRYVTTAAELEGVGAGEQVLGLFTPSHLAYVAERREDSSQPTLAEMTAKAIELLSADEDGYLLLIEGGRIDHGHHIGKPAYALLETQAFARAVETALALVDPDETLILVTADHSHVFTMGGYATRGNPILGLVVGNDKSGEPKTGPEVAADGRPYRTLQYANGPGAVTRLPRPAPELGVHSLAQALVPMRSVNIDGSVTNDETHAGEDVALYATGPGSERVRGVIEQNRIFDIMMAAFGFRGQAN